MNLSSVFISVGSGGSLVEKTVKTYGRLDYALNNPGIALPTTSLVEQTSNVFDRIRNVNVKGVWLCMKYEIPQMRRSGGGVIVNMSVPDKLQHSIV